MKNPQEKVGKKWQEDALVSRTRAKLTYQKQIKIFLGWQDQFNRGQRYACYHSDLSAYSVANNRTRLTGKRHRLITEDHSLLDIIEAN